MDSIFVVSNVMTVVVSMYVHFFFRYRNTLQQLISMLFLDKPHPTELMNAPSMYNTD